MNFVDMVEDLRIECGVSGSQVLSVQSLSGELARLKKWISDAWNEIQLSRREWKFLESEFSFSTTPSTQSYTPAEANAPDMDTWKQDSFWIYQASRGVADQMPIGDMRWNHFREMYIRGVQTPQRPVCYSIAPNKALWLGALPDDVYTISGEYWKLPILLANDTDIPVMPPRFHKLIVYEAMKKYAGYEAASEVYQRGITEGSPLWTSLEIDQLPAMTVAGGFDGEY